MISWTKVQKDNVRVKFRNKKVVTVCEKIKTLKNNNIKKMIPLWITTTAYLKETWTPSSQKSTKQTTTTTLCAKAQLPRMTLKIWTHLRQGLSLKRLIRGLRDRMRLPKRKSKKT